jgi:hypothetical protein
MSEDRSKPRLSTAKKIVVSAILGGGSLVVVFFKPLVEKKGKQFAGTGPEEHSQATPQLVVVQTPKSDSGGQPAMVVLQPTRTPESSAPAAEGSPAPAAPPTNSSPPETDTASARTETQVVISTAVPKRREPVVFNHDIQVPQFENTDVVEYVPSSGLGTGKNREEAVFKALEEAMSKQGAQISAQVRLNLLAETKKFNDTTSRRVEQSVASDFSRSTDGLVRWWDLKREEDTGSSYQVEVVAVIAKIKSQSAEHATRKTIAVLPFRASGPTRVLDKTISPDDSGRMFRESVLTYLVQSRKFAVVDKTFEEEVDRLAALTPATDPIQRALQAAVKLGAQYVVIGGLEAFGVSSSSADQSLAIHRPSGAATLRVIEVKTRQTVLAAAYQMDELAPTRLDGPNPETFLVDAVGRVMADRILETIYPFKVAGLNGPDEVILNRGGESLAVGERVELFNPGDELKDPATGESLGVAERKVATAEIIRVLPKVSYARILTKTEPVVADAVCRKPQLAKKDAEKKTGTIKKNMDSFFK